MTSFPTEAEIDRAAAILRSGGLVAFPTETVYGLGANALSAEAVAKIYKAKGRPATSPLIVHVASVDMARTIAARWPDSASVLAKHFWPGPLTLVLPKLPIVPDSVTSGLDTVGIRVPSHPVALRLLERAGVPIAAPSANRFTKLSPTEARHVREGLGAEVDCILDGGPTQIGIESTVISLANDPPRLLRPGMITLAEIESLIGPVAKVKGDISGAHVSPGLHPKHYSPQTKLIVTTDPPAGRGIYLWWNKEHPTARALRMPADPSSYARGLYTTLHRLDEEKLEFIAVEPVPESDAWEAIRDRLKRASS